MKISDEERFLSWFLGPKGEQGEIVENFLLMIWRDYIHWRRNYYPQDGVLITRKIQREIEPEIDKLYQNLIKLLSRLRRNFPFYSPRYIGHMLSEISYPAILGYFAGVLHNSNNVTPEAAPVTVELEIETANKILKMLGYKPPPEPPSDLLASSISSYIEKLRREFGWAHITQGGSLANLEAMWVAINVKYTALSIMDICKRS